MSRKRTVQLDSGALKIWSCSEDRQGAKVRLKGFGFGRHFGASPVKHGMDGVQPVKAGAESESENELGHAAPPVGGDTETRTNVRFKTVCKTEVCLARRSRPGIGCRASGRRTPKRDCRSRSMFRRRCVHHSDVWVLCPVDGRPGSVATLMVVGVLTGGQRFQHVGRMPVVAQSALQLDRNVSGAHTVRLALESLQTQRSSQCGFMLARRSSSVTGKSNSQRRRCRCTAAKAVSLSSMYGVQLLLISSCDDGGYAIAPPRFKA